MVNSTDHCTDRGAIVAGLAPLFERARREGLWFRSIYTDAWYAPDELDALIAAGREVYGASTWDLVDPEEYARRLEARATWAANRAAGIRERIARSRAGFTLVELLVVILIIGLVTVVALPTVLPAFQHRQVSEAGRILHGELVGARDRAIHTGQPCGIRLLPDPVFPIAWQPATINGQPNPTANQLWPYQTLCYNRIIPLESAPEYSEGAVVPIPTQALAAPPGNPYPITPLVGYTGTAPALGVPALVLCECPLDPATGLPASPTSWFWNIRVGDKVQVGGAGLWYTVVGPMAIPPSGATINGTFYANNEMFVNVGPPAPIGSYGNAVPSLYFNGQPQPVEFLVLVNGVDDNKNGWTDEGYDGVNNGDQNPAIPLVDEPFEWETEAWGGSVASRQIVNASYTIRRRPAPAPATREVSLPTSMVVDATTAFMARERSRLPVNLFTGYVDIVLNPDGTLLPTTVYSSPSSFGMDSAFYHFWIAERQDVVDVQLTPPPPGSPPGTPATPPPIPIQSYTPQLVRYLPMARPGGTGANAHNPPYLKGQYSVLSLNARSGAIVVTENPPVLYDPTLGYQPQAGSWNPTNPFIQAEQGLAGGR